MFERQEKAPRTQHAATVRALALCGAAVAALAATAVTSSAVRTLLGRFRKP